MSKLQKAKSQDILKSYEDWKKVLLDALKTKDMDKLPKLDFKHPFFQKRIEELDKNRRDDEEGMFLLLKIEYDAISKRKDIEERKIFIKKEIEEFERLFISGEQLKGWNYFDDRMFFDGDEIENLYQYRGRVLKGEKPNDLDTDEENSMIAMLEGVRLFTGFLKMELNELNKKDKKEKTEIKTKRNISKDTYTLVFTLKPSKDKWIDELHYNLVENGFIKCEGRKDRELKKRL